MRAQWVTFGNDDAHLAKCGPTRLPDFLDRLPHAKDKTEFDQFMAERFMAERFMAERRNRPLSPLRS